MTILIAGGTGFLGRHLANHLEDNGHDLIILTRSSSTYEGQGKHDNRWYKSYKTDVTRWVNEADAVINLAGEGLFDRRWTESVKKKLYHSRIDTTRVLVEAIEHADNRPQVFVSGSAVGYYGSRGEKPLDEQAAPGDDFLARLCVDWEHEASKAEKFGVRVVNPRTGLPLEKDGGVLEQMLMPFQFFVGGAIGDGSQYMPWIHVRDFCRSITFAMQQEDVSGAYNACAPEPVTMKEFAETLGRVLNRPSLFNVPEPLLKVAFGEAADFMTASLNVRPAVLQERGFTFDYTGLEEALRQILRPESETV